VRPPGAANPSGKSIWVIEIPLATMAANEKKNHVPYGLDWIEQGLTSPPTQYRLSGRQTCRMDLRDQHTVSSSSGGSICAL